MLKQLLSKFPRKSSKSEATSDSLSSADTNDETSSSNSTQKSSTATTNGSKKTSSAVFPSSVVAGIEPLLSFKEVSGQDKQNLFLSKMNLCCVIFDFNDHSKNIVEKEIKARALLELSDYVSTATGNKLSEQAIAAGCKMFAANLFRVFPPSYRSGSAGENDEDEPKFDPAWPHLQLVYDLLLKFIASNSLDSKLAKRYIDHWFILQLLDLFDSEDPRERESLKTILHRIYGKFMVHRPFIRKSVANIFYRFIFETEKHNGIPELLEVMGSVISGFAMPLKEEHKMFLSRVLIPLHKSKSVGVYLQQLTFCVVQFIDKDPRLASVIIAGLLKFWPVTNSQKEVMLLGELEEILETTTMAEFQKVMVPLFRRISRCFNSSHFQVAERALFLWNNDHIGNLVLQNREVILPVILPALEKNARGHWNQSVLNATLNVRKMFSDMDEELFVSCCRRYQDDEAQRAAAEERRRDNWSRLEAAAAAALRPASGYSAAVLVNPPAASSFVM